MTDGEVPFDTKELKEYVIDSFKNHGHMPSRVEKDILGYIDEVINDYFENKVVKPESE